MQIRFIFVMQNVISISSQNKNKHLFLCIKKMKPIFGIVIIFVTIKCIPPRS